MVARALVTHPGSREAFLATLMLCSDGSRDVHVHRAAPCVRASLHSVFAPALWTHTAVCFALGSSLCLLSRTRLNMARARSSGFRVCVSCLSFKERFGVLYLHILLFRVLNPVLL